MDFLSLLCRIARFSDWPRHWWGQAFWCAPNSVPGLHELRFDGSRAQPAMPAGHIWGNPTRVLGRSIRAVGGDRPCRFGVVRIGGRGPFFRMINVCVEKT